MLNGVYIIFVFISLAVVLRSSPCRPSCPAATATSITCSAVLHHLHKSTPSIDDISADVRKVVLALFKNSSSPPPGDETKAECRRMERAKPDRCRGRCRRRRRCGWCSCVLFPVSQPFVSHISYISSRVHVRCEMPKRRGTSTGKTGPCSRARTRLGLRST